ncbi:TRAP transporter fused permease subunit [Microbaculum marinum]|uniref:TRAP transporter fused permease subunit n=1 Tax=Microbaculum marinum TaxID=1764581 RepID=A0AAW9RUM6_9HYPH
MSQDPTQIDVPLASPAVRLTEKTLGALLALVALAWAADAYRMVGMMFLAEQFLAVVLGLALAAVFVRYPFRRDRPRRTLPWYDAVLAALGLATGLYVAWSYPTIIEMFFDLPIDGLICSWILFVLCIEGLRRAVGMPLVVIVLVFTAYALVGHLVPGALQTRQVQINRMILYLGMDTSGLFGLVMLVGVTIVIPFIFFGQLLFNSGGSAFFNDLSLALMGRFRGGAAKISVTASSLFGSISGIVVSNILATGVITIPLMKKAGFSARQAAAIEATASTGGQLMPPVMGAVAFLMADFLQVPYTEIVIAALVPSLLYYVAIFIQADLEAAKLGIKRVPEAQIPRLRTVLRKGWFFVLPFAALVYSLFWLNDAPELAALYACVTVLVLGLVAGYDGERMKPGKIWECVVATGINSLDILMIAAAAGFIMGILQTTGLGFALTLFLVKLGAGSILALLVIAALLCIVLGMGMPTLGVYVLLAVLIAPSLVEVGISPLAAHMFILYLGMMSMITPPVAIAAFFAASLAGAEPMRTGFTAMRFGWTAYIVPFLFVFSPALLLQGGASIATMVAVASAVAGVWIVSAGMIGYFMRPLGPVSRAGFIIGGACLLVPAEIGAWAAWTDFGGLVLSVVVVVFEYMTTRRLRGPEQAASGTRG